MEFPSKVLVLGSAAVKIAEAAEFDYSGSQALKALKEEGIETVLVNPNVATVQTTHRLADKVYMIPVTPEFVEKVIERERPDGILLGFGGQTALNTGVALYRKGVLQKYGVRVLGTPVEGIEKASDKGLFAKVMREAGLPMPPSKPARSVEEALEIADEIGYPVMVRVSFNLGGRGSIIAWNKEQLKKEVARALAQSFIRSVLVEKYLHYWKEIEFEVVRDYKGNSVAVACLENLDPMGVHTGESIVIAPCQTLTNREYHKLRVASIRVAEAIGLVGEGNVQLALSPNSEEFYVIETNPRMSRSSALASKATGYPLAYIAAKLALGYRLDELINKVTGITCACFEPSLDYIVIKIPRWDLEKFPGVDSSIGTEMKSVGEVMAIGRNFEEALQKAIRMLDIGEPGVVAGPSYEEPEPLERVLQDLRERKPYWPLRAAKAFKLGATIDQVYEACGVDKWFLMGIKRIVDLAEKIRNMKGAPEEELAEAIREAKRLGFSDKQLANLLGWNEDEVRAFRKKHGIIPVVKQIDTLAAEWPAKTNYLYVTYNGSEDDIPFDTGKKKIIVLGAGVFRIGVSVEFDWAVVSFAEAARRKGIDEVIVINYNPETVSTDWDVNDKLYFEELTLERVLDIYEKEKPLGVVVFAGGQIANNLAKKLEERGVRILGTSGWSVDMAEDRSKFSSLLEKLGIKQPEWVSARSIDEVLDFARRVGFPVLVRPSYVLSGSAMKIARNEKELLEYLEHAARVSPEHPVVVSKFVDEAVEAEVDAVSDGEKVAGVIIEHIERAGVHSGDSTMVTPAYSLDPKVRRRMKDIAVMLARTLRIKGPFNIQFLIKNGEPYVIELNLRASRSMPFSSKSRGVDLMDLAAEAVLKGKLPTPGDFYEPPAAHYTVKSPQFSWSQLKGSYPHLGPEMRSTGEVASLGRCFEEALLKSWLSSQPNRLPRLDEAVVVYSPCNGRALNLLSAACEALRSAGYQVLTIKGMEVHGAEQAVEKPVAVQLIRDGRVGLVMTHGYAYEKDYEVRRAAADFNVPIVLDADLAYHLAKAIAWYMGGGELEVKEITEYWTHRPPSLQPP